MKTLEQKIEVMKAALDGKEIECVNLPSSEWFAITDPDWQWRACDYRIKQEPMEFWVVVYPNGTPSMTYPTKEQAEEGFGDSVQAIKVREVTDG